MAAAIGVVVEVLLFLLLSVIVGSGIFVLWSILGGILAYVIYGVVMNSICRVTSIVK